MRIICGKTVENTTKATPERPTRSTASKVDILSLTFSRYEILSAFADGTRRVDWIAEVAGLEETVANGLAAYYQYVAEQLHKWVDPLTNEQFWRKPYPYGNSVGHLVLHLTGNLSYYIGARIAETGYVRDRDREFTDARPPHKDQALRAFDRAMAMVVATIHKQDPLDWVQAYTAEREPEAADRFQIVLRCAGHAYHHVGQIVYLSRELART